MPGAAVSARPTPVSATHSADAAGRASRRPPTSMRPPSSLGSMPWLHGVLDQRQQRHRREAQAAPVRARASTPKLQPVGHAQVHQLEVGAHQSQLVAERRVGLVQARHRRAQIGDQVAQHRRRALGARLDQRLHVGQRVEQEVRLDLRVQQATAGRRAPASRACSSRARTAGCGARLRIALAVQRAQRHHEADHQRRRRDRDEARDAGPRGPAAPPRRRRPTAGRPRTWPAARRAPPPAPAPASAAARSGASGRRAAKASSSTMPTNIVRPSSSVKGVTKIGFSAAPPAR